MEICRVQHTALTNQASEPKITGRGVVTGLISFLWYGDNIPKGGGSRAPGRGPEFTNTADLVILKVKI